LVYQKKWVVFTNFAGSLAEGGVKEERSEHSERVVLDAD